MAAILPTQVVDTYGAMVAWTDISDAVIATLKSPFSGLIFYLAERERRTGLAPRDLRVPPSEMSYRRGLDWETYTSDEFPLLIVFPRPEGPPMRHDGGAVYEQSFEVQVAALVNEPSEQESIYLASEYGIAITTCLAQNPGLNGLAVETRPIGFPQPEFVNPDRRTLIRSVSTFRTIVSPVFGDVYGSWPPAVPGEPPPDPYATPIVIPDVNQINLTLTADPLDGSTPAASDTTQVVLDED